MYGPYRSKTLVGHFQRPVVTHRLNDLREESLSGGNFLEKDAPLEVVTLVDEMVYGKGVQQPCPHATLFHILGMFDVVEVSSPPVAFDVDVEHLLDGVLVVVEGLQGQFLTGLVERRALPTLVDLFERNAPGAVDGIDQPDITVEKRGGIAFRRTARFSTL